MMHPIVTAITDSLRELARVQGDVVAAQKVVFGTIDKLARGTVIALHTTAVILGPDAAAATFVEFFIAMHEQLQKFEAIQGQWERKFPRKFTPAQRKALADTFVGMAEGIDTFMAVIARIGEAGENDPPRSPSSKETN